MMVNVEGSLKKDKRLDLQFYDQADVYVRGGSGGPGAVTFKPLRGRGQGPPNGGSGGRGGSVYLLCDNKMNTLQGLRGRASFRASHGEAGGFGFKTGKNAPDVIIRVPPGTVVKDPGTDETLATLSLSGDKWLAARGGNAGVGNGPPNAKASQGRVAFTGRSAPPQAGEKRWIRLELSLLADIGLAGIPNAGKSTLLSTVTNARPKIANYPFTTLVPNLGVWEPSQSILVHNTKRKERAHDDDRDRAQEKDSDSDSGNGVDGDGDGGVLGLKHSLSVQKRKKGASSKGLVLLDIPGLVEGAHKGVGLGLAFLRHVERCRVIFHIVSGASVDPVGDFRALNDELLLFNPRLLEKPHVVVLNKIDLPEVRARLPELRERLLEAMGHERLVCISAATGEGVEELMQRTRNLVDKRERMEDERLLTALADDEGGDDTRDAAGAEGEDATTSTSSSSSSSSGRPDGYWIENISLGKWRIGGDKVTKAASLSDWTYYSAEERFCRVLDAIGFLAALEGRGAREGDEIEIAGASKRIRLMFPTTVVGT